LPTSGFLQLFVFIHCTVHVQCTCTESKIKEATSVVGCDSATPEALNDSCKPGTTLVYRKDNIAAAPPPSAAAMMYSYAPSADTAAYDPLVKSPCFTMTDRSTSGCYGADVTNRMYSSVTSLADAYLMQATLPHLHQHPHGLQGPRRVYNSALNYPSLKAAEQGNFVPCPAGDRDQTVNGNLGFSQPLIPTHTDSQSSMHQFLPSISEFGSIARHSYC